jgi:hypothetical protein
MKFLSGYLACALLLAGCGAPEAPKVPTAQQPAPASATAPAPAADTDFDKALRYTRCMTDHGAAHPDPVVGMPLVTYNVIDLHETGAGAAQTGALIAARREAHQQCKRFLPTSWPLKEDPAETARSKAFRACLREHGIEANEPDANGMVNYPTDTGFWDTPQYMAAEDACRHLVDDPANKVPS